MLQGVSRAFGRAVVSQFHPAMLLALLLPFLIVLLGSVILIWLFWAPVTEWLRHGFETWPVIGQVEAWLLAMGLVSLQLWLVPILAACILLPLSGLAGIAVAAVFVMPLVLRHLGEDVYSDVARRGQWAFAASAWNATWVVVLFCVGWMLTMPLWLFPPLALVLPTLWWTFAFTRMLRLDALVEHASPEERRRLIRRHNVGFWTLGFICALLSLLPPAWLFLPVFSSLFFAHFALEAVRRERQTAGPPDAAGPGAGRPSAAIPLSNRPS